jgi:hypothetical protein
MLRTGNLKLYSLAAVLAVTLVLCVGASAQSYPDTFAVTYYSNAHETGAPDGKLRVDNPGVDNGKNLCADVYVFDAFEEMLECCGCKVTPDGLRTFSVNKDLTGNTGNGEVPAVGVIKLLSGAPNTASGGCDPTGGASFRGFPNNIVPTPDLRAWQTHIYFTGHFLTSDQEVQAATLSTAELDTLQRTCFGILQLGSGRGKCTCGSGD